APPRPAVTAPGRGRAGRDTFGVWVGEPEPGPVRHPGPAAPDDATGHLLWLREETARFNYHVAQHLESARARRQQLADLESQVESKCIAREQEMNRLHATLTARAEAGPRRRAEARRREAGRREAEQAEAAAGLAAREAEVRAREEHLAGLRTELADLERRAQELRPAVAELEGRRSQVEEELKSLAGQRAALEAKEAALE